MAGVEIPGGNRILRIDCPYKGMSYHDCAILIVDMKDPTALGFLRDMSIRGQTTDNDEKLGFCRYICDFACRRDGPIERVLAKYARERPELANFEPRDAVRTAWDVWESSVNPEYSNPVLPGGINGGGENSNSSSNENSHGDAIAGVIENDEMAMEGEHQASPQMVPARKLVTQFTGKKNLATQIPLRKFAMKSEDSSENSTNFTKIPTSTASSSRAIRAEHSTASTSTQTNETDGEDSDDEFQSRCSMM